MGNDSNPKKIAASSTTTIGSVMVYAISVNKTLAGTVSVNEGTTNTGIFAATTPPGTYHVTPNGARYGNLIIGLSGADDVTLFSRAI